MRYIEQNKKEFEICGILRWHELGYTGEGIRISEIEPARPDLWFFDGKLHDPFGYGTKAQLNCHGQKVLDVAHQVAPDADMYSLYSSITANGDEVSGNFVEKTLPYAIENGIHIIGASLGGIDNPALNEKIKEAQEHGIIFVTSAGNEGEKGLTGFAASNMWIAIGAVGWNDSMKEIFLKSYSSRGPELDIVGFSGLYVYNAKDKNKTMQMEGTSFSSPSSGLGMCALVQQFFLEKAGRTLYQDEMLQFIYDHTIDLGEEGFDEEYGHGLFVLPEPEEIDVEKYLFHGGDSEVSEIKGIDVSKHQGTINWSKVKAAGIKFAMIRASYGQQSLDSKFVENIKAAQSAGIDVGAYHYCYATSIEEAKAEARHFIDVIKPYNLTYPAVLDLEDPSQAGLDKILLTDMAIAFMEIVKEAGFYPMLYASKYWLESKLDYSRLKKYDVWLAQWGAKPTWAGDFGLWQYADSGKVEGISGSVDLDIAYKDYPILTKKEAVVVSDYEKHWAKAAIDKVKAAGLMSGYPDGSFKPDGTVTRAELATVLAKLLEKIN